VGKMTPEKMVVVKKIPYRDGTKTFLRAVENLEKKEEEGK